MGGFVDLTGAKFGRLEVISRGSVGNDGGVKWKCKCQCGVIKEVRGNSLRTGATHSCGCLQRESARALAKHGHQGGYKQSPEYMTWRAMLRRCSDEAHVDYPIYGGRGITVCEQWKDFANFIADVGTRPSGHTLDRREKDGNYEPGNVRWATAKDQARNMRSNRMLTLNGVTKCTAEWAEELGISHNTLRARLFLGWSEERTLTEPSRGKSK